MSAKLLNAVNEKSQEEVAVDFTVMAIRECLMSYFKGDCVRNVMRSNICMQQPDSLRTAYSYQRRRINQINRLNVLINDVHILTLQKMPNVITFKGSMNRSPQLRRVKDQTGTFLSRYLRSVEQKHSTRAPGDVDDSELVKQNIPTTDGPDTIESPYIGIDFEQFVQPRPNSMPDGYTFEVGDHRMQWSANGMTFRVLNDHPDVTEETMPF